MGVPVSGDPLLHSNRQREGGRRGLLARRKRCEVQSLEWVGVSRGFGAKWSLEMATNNLLEDTRTVSHNRYTDRNARRWVRSIKDCCGHSAPANHNGVG